MTQEQKELLLKDLCGRLPYGVEIQIIEWATLDTTLKTGHIARLLNNDAALKQIKPYLFPLSSMTEEQKKYVTDRWGINENFDFEIDPDWGKYFVKLNDALDFINWCYENHLDINGLILKDLAIDAIGLNIYKEE